MDAKDCIELMESRGYTVRFRSTDWGHIHFIKEYQYYNSPETVEFPIFAKVIVSTGVVELTLIKSMFKVSSDYISIDNKYFEELFEKEIIDIGQRLFR